MSWTIIIQPLTDAASQVSKCSCSCDCSCGWQWIDHFAASAAQKSGYTMGEQLDPPAVQQRLGGIVI